MKDEVLPESGVKPGPSTLATKPPPQIKEVMNECTCKQASHMGKYISGTEFIYTTKASSNVLKYTSIHWPD